MNEAVLPNFDAPLPRWPRFLVKNSLRLRGRLVRLLPPRRRPHLLTRVRNRTYQKGYAIGELGAN